MAWMIIRVRGTIHARHDIRETLDFLHLTRANHATIVPESPEFKGMLSRVQGYVTWGEAEPSTVSGLLQRRGITPEGASLGSGETGPGPKGTVDTLAAAVIEHGLSRAPGVRPVFRLKAPTGGWRSTKRPFSLGGALGYRGRAINELAQKMW